MPWNKLVCSQRDLHILGTLSGGQSFRWTHDKDSNEWTGIFSKTLWKLRQQDDFLQYQVLGSLLTNTTDSKPKKKVKKTLPKVNTDLKNEKTDLNNEKTDLKIKNTVSQKDNGDLHRTLLTKYFRLDMNLVEHYKEWSEKDELFKTACEQFYGIRMLCQEPVENLFSFICSQNNHISRISSMVEKLCTHYGEEICSYDGIKYYAFPEVESLADPKVESQLRELGFGYRAKFIQKSAAQIVEWGGVSWFNSLQEMKYKEARQELMKLHGIGPKVADCISLMSLNHLESLPVDTHVYQIAAQNYLPHLRGKKNVTDKMYAEIGDHFRNLYGDMAGWAHTVLFCADLKKFQQNGKEAEETCSKPKKKKK